MPRTNRRRALLYTSSERTDFYQAAFPERLERLSRKSRENFGRDRNVGEGALNAPRGLRIDSQGMLLAQ